MVLTKETQMQIGMIGLGRMGASMVRRLLRSGQQCVVHDRQPALAASLQRDGAQASASIAELVSRMTPPRAIWLMVPAGAVDQAITDLVPHLESGDIVIDGGNSHYRDDIRRARNLAAAGIHHIDVGTSGGVAGQDRGYCLMIGGSADVVARLQPAFEALAPGVAAAPRTPGRSGSNASAEQGFLHCGPNGAGHFVVADLRSHMEGAFGRASSDRYWAIFEELRHELGYADYLGALQRYRADAQRRESDDEQLLLMSSFLIDYPFAERLYPEGAGGRFPSRPVRLHGDSLGRRRGLPAPEGSALGLVGRCEWPRIDLRSQGTNARCGWAPAPRAPLRDGRRQAAAAGRGEGGAGRSRDDGVPAARALRPRPGQCDLVPPGRCHG
jgi:hypothetical protein